MSLLVAVCALAVLVFYGIVWPNRIFAAGYEVKGVDVAHYQGRDRLGDSREPGHRLRVDQGDRGLVARRPAVPGELGPRQRDRTPRRRLSLHEFREFRNRPGRASRRADPGHARHPPTGHRPRALRAYIAEPPAPEQVRRILDDLVAGVEKRYGATPIVYVTEEAYDLYVAGLYPQLKVWIRSVAVPPSLSDGRGWTFWQYSNRDRLGGYDGVEPYIDMNAFAGTREELESMTLR
jgi:lysozyme